MNASNQKPRQPKHLRGAPAAYCAGCAAILIVLCQFGCGTGEYKRRMQERIDELGQSSQSYELLFQDAIDIVAGTITIQLPIVFDGADSFNATSESASGLAIDPQRIKPPYAELPGYLFCYERFIDADSDSPKVLYSYFAVQDAAQSPQTEITTKLQKELQAKFPGTGSQWETIQLQTDDGATIDCRRISVQGSQRFDLTPVGGPLQEFDGRMDLYLHSTPEQHILIGWRAMSEAAVETNFFEAAEASVGTLKIDGEP